MNVDKIIDDVIQKEGGSRMTNDPNDFGGRTQFGIAESSNPLPWKDGKVTEDEAREIYKRKYYFGPGFDKIENPRLQGQMVDFGVTSGPRLAIQKVQEIVGAEVDGVLGPETLGKISTFQGDVNRELVKSRIKMIGRIVVKNPSQLKFLNGWLNRALEFL